MNAQPYLEITVQPVNQFHFRYESEMKESHGFLTGEGKRTFPTVCLRNFNGPAKIRCSLYQMPKEPNEQPFPHSHSLVIRVGREYIKDPHDVIVSQSLGYQAIFKGLRIRNTKVPKIKDELTEKFVTKYRFECGLRPDHELTPEQKGSLKTAAEDCVSKVNLNQVVLCFEAYTENNGRINYLCDPVFSTPINEKRNASYGELKINRISATVGSAKGNEELFMFVKKVDKNNIRVRFYEQNDDGEEIWCGEGDVFYVHYQYGIAVKTPPYQRTNNNGHAKVFIQLYRSHDHATSEPVEFQYELCHPSNTDGKLKRQRTSSSGYDTDVADVVQPPVVETSAQHRSPSNNHQQQDYGLDELLADIPEYRSVVCNPNVIEDFLKWVGNNYKKLNEYNKEVLDSASSEAADGENSQEELQRKVEEFILKFLEIPLLKNSNAGDQQFHSARKLCSHIFERAIFGGDNTIVHLCAKSDDSTLAVRFLEIIHKFKLDELLNGKNYNHETCVHLSCAANNVKVLQKSMEYGADVNALDWNGNTALHIAVKNDNIDCVSTLLNTTSTAFEQKIDIDLNVFNDSGFTPLDLAAMKNNLEIVEMLTHKAIQTHCLSIFDDANHDYNALHIAIESNAHDVAEYLIKNDCISPLKMNKSGYTAVDLARRANAMHLVNLMEQSARGNGENLLNNLGDYDDASSDDQHSFKHQDTKKVASIETAKSFTGIDKLTKSDAEIFDERCLAELNDIFNENDKWKLIADELGYQGYVEIWQKSPNPTKVLFKFFEALKVVSKDRLVEIFQKLGEKRAIQCIYEWNDR